MARNGHLTGVNELRRDFNALRADFASLSKDFGKMRKSAPHEIGEELGARVDDIKERIEKTADSLVDDAEEQLGAARKLLKEHPGTAISGAFVLGLIVARLLR